MSDSTSSQDVGRMNGPVKDDVASEILSPVPWSYRFRESLMELPEFQRLSEITSGRGPELTEYIGGELKPASGVTKIKVAKDLLTQVGAFMKLVSRYRGGDMLPRSEVVRRMQRVLDVLADEIKDDAVRSSVQGRIIQIWAQPFGRH